jgi:hypothetical protein
MPQASSVVDLCQTTFLPPHIEITQNDPSKILLSQAGVDEAHPILRRAWILCKKCRSSFSGILGYLRKQLLQTGFFPSRNDFLKAEYTDPFQISRKFASPRKPITYSFLYGTAQQGNTAPSALMQGPLGFFKHIA